MDRDEALDRVTEVTASASEKKQLDQYEPATAHVEYTATVGEDDDPVALREELSQQAEEDAKRAILRRWEEYVRKAAGDDE